MVRLTERIVTDALIRMGVPYTTTAKFVVYHYDNPHIYAAFREVALRLLKGTDHCSAKHIMEVVRAEKKYSILNDYTTYYGRTFVEEFPEYRDCFDFREVRGLATGSNKKGLEN